MSRIIILLPVLMLIACRPDGEKILEVKVTPAQAASDAARIENETPITLAPGLKISLWASDSLAPDPIAMSIDDQGRIYLTSTERQKHSEFDIRGHQDWMTPSISFRTVEDRRAFLRKTFAPERSAENTWLEDLNRDGVHDWHDLTVERDEVWRLTDDDGDGRADRSARIVHDFHEEITDVAEGLLVRENDMFIGIGPDLWRLEDRDHDGVPEFKESISHGWAVHIGFGGHGMSGIVEGPDGKIYWGIGDIGANLTDKEGNRHEYPNEGIIVRSNPDGTGLEVFAMGLRNTHEFVFDAYGNLITSDNDGDHAGESERLMHIVEGADIGWRANWQYGKYTDPRNNRYNVWMDERFSIPRWEGQAAHILPPIMNYHNGPTGMVYNPGTALGPDWAGRFFLVEFTGTPTRSHIWSFALQPKGASFTLRDEVDMVGGILPTGIRFGPDGALYAADWINGWGTKDYGRVWKVDVDDAHNTWKDQRKATLELMRSDFKQQSIVQLSEQLGHADMRIRQKAQFELVRRGNDGVGALIRAMEKSPNQMARIHGIWGLGQLNKGEHLVAMLKGSDDEIIAQAAKVIGDIRYSAAADQLRPLLQHRSDRVKFFAAQALGRIRDKSAVNPLIELVAQNKDADLYLRHAAVLALSRIGAEKEMAALASATDRSLKIAAVLVLRRMKSPLLSSFLSDADEYIVTEAVRAIHDDTSVPQALPAVAALLGDGRTHTESVIRRAISACQRLGGNELLKRVADFAENTKASVALRAEAMAVLGTWADPSPVDRVDGWYRGPVKRDAEPVRAIARARATAWLNDRNPELILAVATMLDELKLSDFNDRLAQLASEFPAAAVRAGMLPVLSKLGYGKMETVLTKSLNDRDETVRSAGIGLLSGLSLTDERLASMAKPILEKGGVSEQQQLLRVLDQLPPSRTEALLTEVAVRLEKGTAGPEILLEFNAAVDSAHSENLRAAQNRIRNRNNELLQGGNAGAGEGYFYWNATGQCVRCHTMGTEGGKVGPPLTHIGETLSRAQILEALMTPDARIAPGYGTVTLSLTDGSTVSGTVLDETATAVRLKTQEAEPLNIAVSRIKGRKYAPSGMPALGQVMSREELRNLIEFLATRKRS